MKGIHKICSKGHTQQFKNQYKQERGGLISNYHITRLYKSLITAKYYLCNATTRLGVNICVGVIFNAYFEYSQIS